MLERTYQFLVLLIQSITTFLKVLVRSQWFPKKLNKSSDDIFIFANGPSLNKEIEQYGSALKNKNILCVNKFPDTVFFDEYKPANFIISGPEFWDENPTDIHNEERSDMISALLNKTTWPLQMFLPYAAKKYKSFIKRIETNKNISITFYNTTPLEGLDKLSILFMNMRLASPRPHNVLVPSIQICINSGYKNVYLLGVDHSWLPQISVNNENEVLINQKHFYDKDSSIARPMQKLKGNGHRKLHEVLEKFYYSFRSYHLLQKFAIINNASVINLTDNSFIDAFPKRTIGEIL